MALAALPTAIDLFPLASSPVVSPKLAILAYLAVAPDTAPEIAKAIHRTRVQAWNLLNALEFDGYVATSRKQWKITPLGMNELRSVTATISALVKEAERNSKQA